jgi:hypothetical protein
LGTRLACGVACQAEVAVREPTSSTEALPVAVVARQSPDEIAVRLIARPPIVLGDLRGTIG